MYYKGWLACTTPLKFPWGRSDINGARDVPTLDSFKWELCNLDNDFTQGNNLMKSEDNKETDARVLKVVNALWWEQAVKYQILPLILSETAGIDAIKELPSLVTGKKKFIYEDGIFGIPEGCAPSLHNISYTITAYVNFPEQSSNKDTAPLANSVQVTQGGRFGGWGLVVLDSKPVWVYKCSQMRQQQVCIHWDKALEPGMQKLEVHFEYLAKEGILGGPGRWTLMVNDGEKKSKDLRFSVAGRYTVTETLDIGCDTGTPTLEEYADKMPFKFNGKVSQVLIDLDDSNLSVKRLLSSEQEKRFIDHMTE